MADINEQQDTAADPVEVRQLEWQADAFADLLVHTIVSYDGLADLFEHLGDRAAQDRVLRHAIRDLTWLLDNPGKRDAVAGWARPRSAVVQ